MCEDPKSSAIMSWQKWKLINGFQRHVIWRSFARWFQICTPFRNLALVEDRKAAKTTKNATFGTFGICLRVFEFDVRKFLKRHKYTQKCLLYLTNVVESKFPYSIILKNPSFLENSFENLFKFFYCRFFNAGFTSPSLIFRCRKFQLDSCLHSRITKLLPIRILFWNGQ